MISPRARRRPQPATPRRRIQVEAGSFRRVATPVQAPADESTPVEEPVPSEPVKKPRRRPRKKVTPSDE